MKTGINIFILLAIATVSCTFKNNESKRTDDSIPGTQIQKNEALNLPTDFDSFYSKFVEDSIYQVEHLIFPLEKGSGIAFCDSLVKIDRLNWQIFKDDIRVYNSVLDSLVVKKIENYIHLIKLRKELGVIYELKFRKKGNAWYLVFYFENAC